AMTLGAEPGVGEDLRDGIARGGALFRLVGARQVLDVVGRVVVADELQAGGHRFDEVVGLDDGHGGISSEGVMRGTALQAARVNSSPAGKGGRRGRRRSGASRGRDPPPPALVRARWDGYRKQAVRRS